MIAEVRHDYETILLRMREDGLLPDGFFVVVIVHKDECDIFNDGMCDCNPEIEVKQ